MAKVPVKIDSDRTPQTIVYYDGVCGLCNGVVNTLLDLDQREKLKFAPLQGETARENLPKAWTENADSIVVTAHGVNYRKSAGVVQILCDLGGLCGVAGWALWAIPSPIRDLGYHAVAQTRYRLFGKLEACRMPRPGEQDRFLP
ncbi:thiol-disulfide oxidoreductase DCC family protein [Planctomicrobium sp. SH527]|uniref:thiol-disulfide oxidoreductase DCC family protein n=1 Tax=Planctomicrobium sp. SH527 TaxID=3448123 RepID=UPI003F5C1B28